MNRNWTKSAMRLLSYHSASRLISLMAATVLATAGCAQIFAVSTTKVTPEQLQDITLPANWKLGYLLEAATRQAVCVTVRHDDGGEQYVCARLGGFLKDALQQLGRFSGEGQGAGGAPVGGKVQTATIKVSINQLEATAPVWISFGTHLASASVSYQATLVGSKGELLATSPQKTATSSYTKRVGVPPGWAVEKAVALASQQAAMDILRWCAASLREK
jgi:hypothetical protein